MYYYHGEYPQSPGICFSQSNILGFFISDGATIQASRTKTSQEGRLLERTSRSIYLEETMVLSDLFHSGSKMPTYGKSNLCGDTIFRTETIIPSGYCALVYCGRLITNYKKIQQALWIVTLICAQSIYPPSSRPLPFKNGSPTTGETL